MTTADIVVGIPTYNDAGRIGRAVQAAASACDALGTSAVCLVVEAKADGTSENGRAGGEVPLDGSTTPVMHVPYPLDGVDRTTDAWLGVPGKGNAIRSVFETARRLGARGCAIADVDLIHYSAGWLDALARPVLEHDVDFVAPYYARQKFAGAINNGIAYPLTRALYGKRVRYPMGGDFACSMRFVDRCMADAAWDSEIVRPMSDLWLTTRALTGGSRVAQAMLGMKRQVWTEPGGNPAAPLVKVLAALFHAADRWQSVWQKVRGSEGVRLVGALEIEDENAISVDALQGIASFRLAQKNLDEIWKLVLPPRTMLELKKLGQMPDESFRLADDVWARSVFDFSLAYHQRTLNREHVLTAFAPLFAAWVSSFVIEMEDATPTQCEERIDRLCLRFESEKPYLISRWRWPDRFSP